MSCEGATQGAPSSTGFYACSTVPTPIVNTTKPDKDGIHNKDEAKKIAFADDGAGSGTLEQLLRWWQDVTESGPMFGYFPKPAKSWLIVKPQYLDKAKAMFNGLNINITTDGHAYLGSFIGSEAGKSAYMKDQIQEWSKDIESLANIAKTEPQLAYAAYVYGTSKRWSFVSRTTPNISGEMKILEHHIKEKLIPAIIGKDFISGEMREIFSLPARLGGMGFLDPSETSDLEYESSVIATTQLTDAIFNQLSNPEIDQEAQSESMAAVKKKKELYFTELQKKIISQSSDGVAKIIELASEKGASCWLTSLPLKRYGFLLNKQEFHDALCLRYNFAIKLAAKTCACGEQYSVNHCLTCKRGGYVILRHNSLRDLFAELLREICHDVTIEPLLLPLEGEKTPCRFKHSQ